jgi:hypothetical protein
VQSRRYTAPSRAFLPLIHRSPLLHAAINLTRVCIRKLQFPGRIECLVKLLHITSSDERRCNPLVTWHPRNRVDCLPARLTFALPLPLD